MNAIYSPGIIAAENEARLASARARARVTQAEVEARARSAQAIAEARVRQAQIHAVNQARENRIRAQVIENQARANVREFLLLYKIFFEFFRPSQPPPRLVQMRLLQLLGH